MVVCLSIHAHQVIARENVTYMVHANEEDVNVKQDTQEMASMFVPVSTVYKNKKGIMLCIFQLEIL